MVGRTLRNQTEAIPSSRRAISLLVPGKLILETTADPGGVSTTSSSAHGARFTPQRRRAGPRGHDKVPGKVRWLPGLQSMGHVAVATCILCERDGDSVDKAGRGRKEAERHSPRGTAKGSRPIAEAAEGKVVGRAQSCCCSAEGLTPALGPPQRYPKQVRFGGQEVRFFFPDRRIAPYAAPAFNPCLCFRCASF